MGQMARIDGSGSRGIVSPGIALSMRPAVALQYLLPHRLLSRLALYAAYWRWRPWKNWLIGMVVRRFDVNLSEAAQPDPRAYPSFNAFFTRALKPGARTPDADGKRSAQEAEEHSNRH